VDLHGEGTVSERSEPDHRGRTFPLISFDWEERRIEIEGVSAPSYWVGRRVVMGFPPVRTDNAIIASIANRFLFPLALRAAAAFLLLAAPSLSTQAEVPRQSH
jgi:hypothetical protein